jgi:hypothetical protein
MSQKGVQGCIRILGQRVRFENKTRPFLGRGGFLQPESHAQAISR